MPAAGMTSFTGYPIDITFYDPEIGTFFEGFSPRYLRPFPAEDVPTFFPSDVFKLWLHKVNRNIQFCQIYYNKTSNFIGKNKHFLDFVTNPKCKEIYIEFVFPTTSKDFHSTMIHVKKVGKKALIFFKNSFGDSLKGNLKSFPNLIKCLNKYFDGIEITSDKTRQQILSSYSCSCINYFNMVDHLLDRPYRIPPIESSEKNSPKVSEYRSLFSRDYEKFRDHCKKSLNDAEKRAALELPKQHRLSKKLQQNRKHSLLKSEINQITQLFKLQKKYFMESMNKINVHSFLSEKVLMLKKPLSIKKKMPLKNDNSQLFNRVAFAGCLLSISLCGLYFMPSMLVILTLSALVTVPAYDYFYKDITKVVKSTNTITKADNQQNLNINLTLPNPPITFKHKGKAKTNPLILKKKVCLNKPMDRGILTKKSLKK